MASLRFALGLVATAVCFELGQSVNIPYQFQSDSGGDGVNVYWYTYEQTIKFMFEYDFGSDGTDQKYLGIGFRSSDSGMGPGTFYIGDTDSMNVDAYELTGSYGKPTTFTDDSVVETSCEVQDTTLYCYVVRTLGDLFDDDLYLAYAHGDTDGSGFASGGAYHDFSNRGSSGGLDILALAPTLPSVALDGVMDAQWSPTPAGYLDVFLNSLVHSDQYDWVAIGFGSGDSGMGPAEFYVAQESGVSNDYLSDTYGTPAARTTSNIVSSSCDAGGGRLNCSFTRPLVGDASDEESLESGSFYIRYGVGTGTSSGISKHGSDRALSGSAVELFTISAQTVDPPTSSGGVLYKVHGILMTFAWLFMLPFGAFVARFRSAVGMEKMVEGGSGPTKLWFAIHQPLQYLGVIFMIIALVLILVQLGGSFIVSPHAVTGIITISLALCQPAFAFCRNGCSKDKDEKAKFHAGWHIFHAIFGYLAIVLALATVFMGIIIFRGTTNDLPGLFLAGFLVAVIGLVIFVIVAAAMAVGNAKAKAKLTKDDDSEDRALTKAEDNKKDMSYVAWILFIVLLVGAVLCAAQIAIDDSRS